MLTAGGIDAVVVSTPPPTHEDLILEAISAGAAVVGDKPHAPDAETGRRLADAAEHHGVLLNAYHNRRWDADIRTLRAVLDAGEVGEPRRFESRFDLYEPHTVEAGAGGGVLSDLGSHLIDQALWLWGPAQSVYGELQPVHVRGELSDGGFFVAISHANGVVSHLSAGKLNRAVGRELRLTGTRGAFRSAGTDVQAAAIADGKRPIIEGDRWGYEDPQRWGTLTTEEGERLVPGVQGRYQAFYEQFAAAIRGQDDSPVPAAQGDRCSRRDRRGPRERPEQEGSDFLMANWSPTDLPGGPTDGPNHPEEGPHGRPSI